MSKDFFTLKNEFLLREKSLRLYETPFPLIAVTGGIGCGKSFFLQKMKERGFFTISADDLVKEAYKSKEAKKFLEKVGIDDVSLLRKFLLFHPDKMEEISQILYRELPALFHEKTYGLKEGSVVVYEVPLLFERKLEEKVDVIIVVSSDLAWQQKVLQNERNIPADEIQRLISLQISLREKERQGDFVVRNLKEEDQDIEGKVSEVISLFCG